MRRNLLPLLWLAGLLTPARSQDTEIFDFFTAEPLRRDKGLQTRGPGWDLCRQRHPLQLCQDLDGA